LKFIKKKRGTSITRKEEGDGEKLWANTLNFPGRGYSDKSIPEKKGTSSKRKGRIVSNGEFALRTRPWVLGGLVLGVWCGGGEGEGGANMKKRTSLCEGLQN